MHRQHVLDVAMRMFVFTVCFRMFNCARSAVEYQDLPILYPDDLLLALYKRGPEVFHKCLFGDSDPAQYWNHVKQHAEWFAGHSARDYKPLEKLVPISLYGDDVNCCRNAEVGTVSCVAWTPDLAYGNTSLLRYYPICVYSDYAATEDTYEDLMKALVPRLRLLTDTQCVDFDWSSDGYAFVLSSLQGDLKWIYQKYSVHNWRQNNFCSLCGCMKRHADVSRTISDFRPSASHVGSLPDLSYFEANRSCIFEFEGMGPQRCLHDCMHSQLLGTGKVANASGIVWLAERGFWDSFQRGGGVYDECMEISLKLAHRDFLTWKKSLKLDVSQPRFSCARLNRRNRTQFAVLSCKAAASKWVTMWLATRCVEHAQADGATELDRLVATCLHSYAAALRCMSENGAILTEAEAEEFYRLVMCHLQSWSVLRARSNAATGRQPGRCLWMILPKHHFLMHAAMSVRRERVNPKTWALFSGEDFVGRIGRVARVCHRANVSRRVLDRYLALLHLEVSKLGR